MLANEMEGNLSEFSLKSINQAIILEKIFQIPFNLVRKYILLEFSVMKFCKKIMTSYKIMNVI